MKKSEAEVMKYYSWNCLIFFWYATFSLNNFAKALYPWARLASLTWLRRKILLRISHPIYFPSLSLESSGEDSIKESEKYFFKSNSIARIIDDSALLILYVYCRLTPPELNWIKIRLKYYYNVYLYSMSFLDDSF